MYVATVSIDDQREPLVKIFYHLSNAWSWCAIHVGEDPDTFGKTFLDPEWHESDDSPHLGCGLHMKTGDGGWSASVELLSDDSKCPTCGHQLSAADAQ